MTALRAVDYFVNFQFPRNDDIAVVVSNLSAYQLKKIIFYKNYLFTSIPILLAVPSTINFAPSKSTAFKSGIFCFAISST